MKTLMISLILLLNFAHAEDAHKNHKSMQMSKESHKHKEHKHGKSNEAFNNVLKKYEELHSAFFENKIEAINKLAKDLIVEIDKIEDEKIAKTLTYTKKKLKEISEKDNIETKRDAMDTVSQGLLVVLEKHAPNKNYSRYYCPMLKKYWIQNITKSEEVVNPYAGDYMPHCGVKK